MEDALSGVKFTEEATSRFVIVGGLRIHYNEAGSGTPLIFVHGGGPGASGWSNFHQNLQDLARSFRCILVDLPLFGKSDKPAEINGSRMGYFASFLRDFMDALLLDRVSLIGNSIGGGTCAKFAIEYPQRLDQLVIMGGGGTVRLDPSKPELLGDGIVALMQYLQDPSREVAEKMLRLFVYDNDNIDLDALHARVSLAIRPDIVAAQRALFADPNAIDDLSPMLPKIAAKTLLLWGREDRFVPFSAGLRYFDGIPDCELRAFAHCGHWVMIEREREFNEMVREFIQSGAREPVG